MALCGIILLGLIPRLTILVSDISSLIQFVPDDAFYYLQTARNIAAGQGSTFDGIHLANGFHPLWMFMLLPFAANQLDSLSFLRVDVAICILFGLLTALVLYALLVKITKSPWVSLVGTALYLLNRPAVLASVNGLETSVSSLLFTISLYLVISAQGHRSSDMIRMGICLGLLFLGRTDNAFYLSALLLVIMYKAGRKNWVQHGLTLGLTILILVGPWLGWNWLNFGSIFQSSADAYPYVLQQNFLAAGHSSGEMLVQSLQNFGTFVSSSLPNYVGSIQYAYQAAVLFCLMVIIRHNRKTSQTDAMSSSCLAILALWALGILLSFVHTFIRWYPREWYFNQLLILTPITMKNAKIFSVLAVFLDVSRRSKAMRAATILLSVGSIVALTLVVSRFSEEAPYPHQIEMLDAASWLRANLKQDEYASAFNAGIMGFFSGRRVVNLDGTINNSARNAIQEGRLFAMMRASSVHYLLDFSPIMLFTYSGYLGQGTGSGTLIWLTEIARPGGSWIGENIQVYRFE